MHSLCTIYMHCAYYLLCFNYCITALQFRRWLTRSQRTRRLPIRHCPPYSGGVFDQCAGDWVDGEHIFYHSYSLLLLWYADLYIESILVKMPTYCLYQVNKMTQPRPELLLASSAVLKLRNGLLLLQWRYISPQGHYFTDIQVKIISFLEKTSIEGEAFLEIKELCCETSYRGGVMPVNINHYITRDSPLYGTDFANMNGWLEVMVSGFDEFLGAKVNSAMLYSTDNLKVGYTYEDCYITSPRDVHLAELAGNKRQIEVDITRLSHVRPLEDTWRGVVATALQAAKQQRETRHQVCVEIGHEARYYTDPTSNCDDTPTNRKTK
jgi:hypothetical protein